MKGWEKMALDIGREFPGIVNQLIPLRGGLMRMLSKASPPDLVMYEFLNLGILSPLMTWAVQNNIPELLEKKPLKAEEIGAKLEGRADFVAPAMNLLAMNGIFQIDAGGAYSNSVLSKRLLPKETANWAGAVSFMNSAVYHELWNDAIIGNPYKGNFYNKLEEDGGAAADFYQAMDGVAATVADAMKNKYPFSGGTKVCDVGAAGGLILEAALKENASLNGIWFDKKDQQEAAENYFEKQKLKERVSFTAGDFFKKVPESCDFYLLAHVLHNWGDENGAKILSNIHKASEAGAKVLVIEKILPDDPGEYSLARFQDVQMRVLTGEGKERTAKEWEKLFVSAGYRTEKNIPLYTTDSIMELVKL